MEVLAGLFGFGIIVFIFIVLPVSVSGIRIIKQYEKGIVFTLGKFTSLRSPGLNIIIPIIQTMSKVDTRSTPEIGRAHV